MRLRKVDPESISRFLKLKSYADYFSLGTQMAKTLAVTIGAEKRIGKRCVYDVWKTEEYLSNNDSIDIKSVTNKSRSEGHR